MVKTAGPPKTTKTETPDEPPIFQMPEILVGDFVLWMVGRNDQEAAAIVNAVGLRSVELTVFFPHGIGYGIRDSVRHIDDPDVNPADLEESGLWQYGPMRKMLLALEKQVQDLSLLLAGNTPDTV